MNRFLTFACTLILAGCLTACSASDAARLSTDESEASFLTAKSFDRIALPKTIIRTVGNSRAEYQYSYNEEGLPIEELHWYYDADGARDRSVIYDYFYNDDNELERIERFATGTESDSYNYDLDVVTDLEADDSGIDVIQTTNSMDILEEDPNGEVPVSTEYEYRTDKTLAEKDTTSRSAGEETYNTKTQVLYDEAGLVRDIADLRYEGNDLTEERVGDISLNGDELVITGTSIDDDFGAENIGTELQLTYKNGLLVQASSEDGATYTFTYTESATPADVVMANANYNPINKLVELVVLNPSE